jgi:hypothetical protein
VIAICKLNASSSEVCIGIDLSPLAQRINPKAVHNHAKLQDLRPQITQNHIQTFRPTRADVYRVISQAGTHLK